ncbi:MAG: MogA/MoaB family molybdenum cofactor biosynthesis protein [Candidatus Bathyarchaeota archaeon]|nr:MogA/MoaB family molybdenum cofactor biosynthesis protein [Candidatus Bathyarchaeota archaeon]MDH5494511.1 MogA/MoaB family molybdenum cofactor biosynthesis protein [Candidatus Bathyarchaeota archaeon]
MSESSRKHKAEAPTKLGFALVTCSTSRFTSLKKGKHVDDPSGDFIVQTLRKSGHKIISRVLASDDEKMIKEAVEGALQNDNVSAIIVCGGTGIAPKDVTIETVTPLLRKILPGFGELFRRLSYDNMGSAAILSRAVAGITNGKVVFCIPGSVNAVRLCLDKLILPETGHIVKHAREKP